MENQGHLKLAELFGKHALWGNGYLPCSEKKTDGVLSELLWDPQKKGYHKHIHSLESYRRDYDAFCAAYDSLDSPHSVPAEPPYACVPYWGSEFWKPKRPDKPSLRLAVFAQRSLNENGASIPLYFPLCEIDDCVKALEVGVNLGKKQPGKEQAGKKQPGKTRRTGLFGWQSFMSVWIAMRFLFSGNEDKLQSVYYSDLVKIPLKDDNPGLLKDEINIIKPCFVLVFGKTGHEQFKGLLDQAGVPHDYICFPCGNGARHDLNAKTLHGCRGQLRDYFDSDQ